MALTATRHDDLCLRQLEGLAHAALDTGEGLAATATAQAAGEGYTVALAFNVDESTRRDYWVEQVEDEFRIARWSRLLDVHVTVTA